MPTNPQLGQLTKPGPRGKLPTNWQADAYVNNQHKANNVFIEEMLQAATGSMPKQWISTQIELYKFLKITTKKKSNKWSK